MKKQIHRDEKIFCTDENPGKIGIFRPQKSPGYLPGLIPIICSGRGTTRPELFLPGLSPPYVSKEEMARR